MHCLVFKEHLLSCSLELTLNIISYVFCFVNNFFQTFLFRLFCCFQNSLFCLLLIDNGKLSADIIIKQTVSLSPEIVLEENTDIEAWDAVHHQ